MVLQTVVEYVDDLNGSVSQEVSTVTFGLDGVTYEIDLDPDNAESLRDVLDPYVTKARRVGGRRKTGARPGGNTSLPTRQERARNQEIRRWANGDGGFTLSPLGRIPREVIRAYETAQENPVGAKKRSSSRSRG